MPSLPSPDALFVSSTTVVSKLDSLSVPSRRSGLGSVLFESPDPTYNCSTRKRRSYQVSFSREEADSEWSFALRNDLLLT
jgi:hypothetical protein